MADYSKLRARFPKAKVGNIKKLIAAIRRSDTALDPLVMKHRINKPGITAFPLSGETDPASWSSRLKSRAAGVRVSSNVSGRGPGRVGFAMSDWINVYASEKGHECGTTACIAGFAYMLGEGKGMNSEVAKFGKFADYNKHLGKFIGVDGSPEGIFLIRSITMYRPSVRPRHVVSLLERFLETGKIDWDLAMGVNPRTGDPTARERAKRAKEREAIIALIGAADAEAA